MSATPLPMNRSVLRATRRTTLGAAVLVTAAAGCDLDPPDDDATPEATPSGSPELTDEEYDVAVVGEALTATSTMLHLVEQTSTTHVGLSTPLAKLTALHEAHRTLLEDAAEHDETAPSPVRVAPNSARAMANVRLSEQAGQRTLADLALKARSGPLARVLASMSAGIAQHATKLPSGRQGGAA